MTTKLCGGNSSHVTDKRATIAWTSTAHRRTRLCLHFGVTTPPNEAYFIPGTGTIPILANWRPLSEYYSSLVAGHRDVELGEAREG